MGSIVLPISLLVIMLIFGGVFLVVTKKQERLANSKQQNNSTKNNKSGNHEKDEVKREDIFKFMEFDKILDDMIVQKKGSKYTMAIKCKGINYDLMSDIEQLAVEEGFITFLNTLRYPIQLYVQAQNIDLKSVIADYRNNISGIRNDFERLDKEYNKVVEAFDSTKEQLETTERERNRVLNVYEYANDIINYVERMSTNKSLLQRNFYVLVSYNISEITASDTFTKEEIINICYTELLTRCQSIISALATCSVDGKTLSSNEVADLLYTAYNRDDKGLLSVREAIESGFYRLYSTSEDAFYKKAELTKQTIREEARLRSLEALKYTIDNGTYIPKKQEQLEMIEEISREANEMIGHEEVPSEIKQAAQETILREYKIMKKELLSQIYEENQEDIEKIKELEQHPERMNKDKEKNTQKEVKKNTFENTRLTNTAETVSSDLVDSNVTNTESNSREEDNNIVPKNLIFEEPIKEEELGNKTEDLKIGSIIKDGDPMNDSIFFDDRMNSASSDEEDESII